MSGTLLTGCFVQVEKALLRKVGELEASQQAALCERDQLLRSAVNPSDTEVHDPRPKLAKKEQLAEQLPAAPVGQQQKRASSGRLDQLGREGKVAKHQADTLQLLNERQKEWLAVVRTHVECTMLITGCVTGI